MTTRIVFLVGASGVGKTAVAEHLQAHPPWTGRTHFFDSIGVPSPEEMTEGNGGGEGWQRWATARWVDKLASQPPLIQLLEAQTRPSFINEALETHPALEAVIILLDCRREVRRHRLANLRRRPELANPQNGRVGSLSPWPGGCLGFECGRHQ